MEEKRKLTKSEIQILALACGMDKDIPDSDLKCREKQIRSFLDQLSQEESEKIYGAATEAAKAIEALSRKEYKDFDITAKRKIPMESEKIPDIATLNIPYIQMMLSKEDIEDIGKLILEGIRVQRDTVRAIKEIEREER